MTQTALFTHVEAHVQTPPTPAPDGYEWVEKAGGRSARYTRCFDCRRPVLSGLDEDLGAFQVTADPTPLTALGEALVLLDDRRTVAARRHAQTGLVLERRSRDRIARHVPGTAQPWRAFDVLPTHQCGSAPLPPQAYAAATVTPLTATFPHPDAPAPF